VRASSTTEVDGVSQTEVAPSVIIDNLADPLATVVVIEFGDLLGDLLDTMSALRGLGLNISKAALTAGQKKSNRFYVTDAKVRLATSTTLKSGRGWMSRALFLAESGTAGSRGPSMYLSAVAGDTGGDPGPARVGGCLVRARPRVLHEVEGKTGARARGGVRSWEACRFSCLKDASTRQRELDGDCLDVKAGGGLHARRPRLGDANSVEFRSGVSVTVLIP